MMRWPEFALVTTAATALLLVTSASAQQLTGDAGKTWTDFQNTTPMRAIAVAADGKSANYWGGMSRSDPADAVNNALSRCEERTKAKCSLYAVNNLVLNGRDWKSARPSDSPAIGRLRGQPWWQNKGPQSAAGLLVWSHGYMGGKDATGTAPQTHVGRFLAAGYDLYRFDREWIRDWPGDATALVEAVKQARSMGYKRVILAGQSAGGWVSMAAAYRGAPVDGVISVAAAHHGYVKDMRDVSVARSEWKQLVGGIKPGPRLFVVNFADDDYDVGGRMDDAKAAFAANGINAVVVEKPSNLKGHGAGNSSTFQRTFASCIYAFIETGARQPPCS